MVSIYTSYMSSSFHLWVNESNENEKQPGGCAEQTWHSVHWLQTADMASHEHAYEEKHTGRLSLGLAKGWLTRISTNQHSDSVHVTWFSNQLSIYL